MNFFFYGIAFVTLGGLAALFIKEKYKGIIFSSFIFLGIIFILLKTTKLFIYGEIHTIMIKLPFPIGIVSIVFDQLSCFFILLISIGSILTSIYSIGYAKHYIIKDIKTSTFYFFLSLLIVSMLLLVIIQNAVAFLILWELMSLSSFFLVTFENEKEEVVNAGIYYLITMHIGLIFLIIGFVILSIKTGSYGFDLFSVYLKNTNSEFNSLIFILFFIGFGTKAGFVPFHSWLPKAHPAAPTPVSGIMSGVMIKTGIYGLLRIILISNVPVKGLSYFILIISIITGIYGILYAIAQTDLKKLLAYSSIENIGIIGIGIGIGMLGLSYKNAFMTILGFSGGILHILNHFIFKSLLFFSTGAVYAEIHTRDIESMGGLIKKMPVTSFLFLIGSIAIIGLPPFNGFISEFLIYSGILKGIISNNNILISILSMISFASLSYIGVLALFCFSKVFTISFLGNPRSNKLEKIKEASYFMIIPMAIFSCFVLLIGFFPQLIFPLIGKVTQLFVDSDISSEVLIFNNYLLNLSYTFYIFIGIFLFIFFVRYLLLKNKKINHNVTWGCGYQTYTGKMQYTSSSFASILLNIAAPFINYKIKKSNNDSIIPQKLVYKSQSNDILENFIINPLIVFIRRLLNIFSWIQSGNTQLYILYGIIFLIMVIIYVLGVG